MSLLSFFSRPFSAAAASPHGGAAPVLLPHRGLRLADGWQALQGGLRRGLASRADLLPREEPPHVDPERVPGRVVHARGSGACGHFECEVPLDALSCASPLATAGRCTPVFVRFATVGGENGSADTVRDACGFAVRFCTQEGSWDLVGSNIPVRFGRDDLKFPGHGVPPASGVHDAFWDAVSLTPASTHMLMWLMSDRALPRSYRMMQGFGVHTFRLVNRQGEAVFCKFHWTPLAGTHALAWDEALQLASADPDFHRRDLWEAIDAGEHPQWALGVQVFTEAEAGRLPFDVMDPTKLVPEELVSVRHVGRLVLDRNPENAFEETGRVAFSATRLIPGIEPGCPNGHDHPVDAPRGKARGNPERFAEHFEQARLFWRSQTVIEQYHIQLAFGVELARVRSPRVRERVLSLLAHVDADLVRGVAQGLGLSAPAQAPEVRSPPPSATRELPITSPPLSLFARAGSQGVRTRRVALLVADGVQVDSLRDVHAALAAAGAVPRLVGARLGTVQPADGAEPVTVEITLAAMPSAMWDALVLPDGAAAQPLLASGAAVEFIRDQYRHAKPILALGRAHALLEVLGIRPEWPDGAPDPGVVVTQGDPLSGEAAEQATGRFLSALAEHRHFERETRAVWV